MARLPDELVERMKREISVQRLAEARGVKLKRSGKELIGLCPFHRDTHPSLNIDPVKNVWQCKGACGKSGSVIDWVMLAEGISVRHALELLRRDYLPFASAREGEPPKKSTIARLPAPIDPGASDQEVLLRIVRYYHQELKEWPPALKYLEGRGLRSGEMIDHFQMGFANRTLGYTLPNKNRKPGADLRGRLEKLGILREKTGHEHFVGSLVIPIINPNGEVVQMYGRKITPNLRAGTPDHLYLPGALRGVWNEAALIASKDIILCEALIDALTFWCAGYRHVTTSYGVNGFTDDHRAAFQRHGTKKIYIAYDRDEAGDRAAQEHGEELMQRGIECFRVQFPKGMDANEAALKTQPASKVLGVFLNSAAWLGKGKRPSVAVIEPPPAEEISEPQSEATNPEPAMEMKNEEPSAAPDPEEKIETAAKEENAIALPTEPTHEPSVVSLAAEPETPHRQEAAPVAMPQPSVLSPLDIPTAMKANGVIEITLRERRYTIRGLRKNTSHDELRCTVTVAGVNGRGHPGEHTDTLDFYSAQRRAAFVKQATEELGVKEDFIRQELGKVRMKLEALRDEQIEKELEPENKAVEIDTAEKAAALELLRDPKLMERILEDFAQCGVVGEETNKKVAYLGAISRMLEKPLAIVVQSSSSAGKTSLMDAVLDFMPEEQRENYSAMTGQSLFYMGEKNLKHKILAIAEQQGAERASYPLKLLQSEGRLKIASTGKDPVSGKHVTHDYTVEGPVMIFLTTTAHEVDEELLNRCIVLTVNEDPEQTRAIHQKQREAQTVEGMWAQDDRAEIVKRQRNAQRMLRPIRVVNEQVKHQTFPDTMIRTRRDHMKFLTLVQAIALLYQHQREIKSSTRKGKTLEYIEATADDVKLALQLVNEVLTPSLEELQAQTRRLLLLLDTMVTEQCQRLEMERGDYRFTRATVRQYTRWGDTQLRVHLRRLEEMEYLRVWHGGPGQTFVYQLNFEMDADGRPVLAGLSQLCNYDANCAGINDRCAGGVRAGSGGIAGGARSEESPAITRGNGDFSQNHEKNTSREIEAGNSIVTMRQLPVKPNGVDKPNGHGLVKRAAGER
jgi:DNA primase catalytic core